jgi:hypothetical protein
MRRPRPFWLAAANLVTIAGLLPISGTVAAAGVHPAPLPDHLQLSFKECPQIILYGVRGSGEQAPYTLRRRDGTTFDAKLGQPVGAMAQKLVTALGGQVGVAANTYRATGVLSVGSVVYPESVREGKQDVFDHLAYLRLRCPSSALIAAGYSQGAHAVHAALPRFPDGMLHSRLFSVVLFGDPLFRAVDMTKSSALGQKPNTWGFITGYGNYPDGAVGLGTHRVQVRGATWVPIPKGVDLNSYCHAGDLVCTSGGGTAPHSTYASDAAGAAGAAYRWVQLAYGGLLKHPPWNRPPHLYAALPSATLSYRACYSLAPGTVPLDAYIASSDRFTSRGVEIVDGQIVPQFPRDNIYWVLGRGRYDSITIRDGAVHRTEIWTVDAANRLADRLTDRVITAGRRC